MVSRYNSVCLLFHAYKTGNLPTGLYHEVPNSNFVSKWDATAQTSFSNFEVAPMFVIHTNNNV